MATPNAAPFPQVIVPPSHPARTLVLCFDGTGDSFDADVRSRLFASFKKSNKYSQNSNVVQLFSLLLKDDPKQQMVFYQVAMVSFGDLRSYGLINVNSPALAPIHNHKLPLPSLQTFLKFWIWWSRGTWMPTLWVRYRVSVPASFILICSSQHRRLRIPHAELWVHPSLIYRFLWSEHLLCLLDQAGDKICLFGFSRGAYTARSLAGMLHKVRFYE